MNGPYWFSYDDEESIAMKTKFVNFLGVAGAMVWSLETDDFGGFNSDKKYPLLHKMNEVLATGETYDPDQPDCSTAPMCDLFIITTTTEATTTIFQETTTTDDGGAGTTTTQGGLEGACTEDHEVLPYPGDCHLYYMCNLESNGSYSIQVRTHRNRVLHSKQNEHT